MTGTILSILLQARIVSFLSKKLICIRPMSVFGSPSFLAPLILPFRGSRVLRLGFLSQKWIIPKVIARSLAIRPLPIPSRGVALPITEDPDVTAMTFDCPD